MNSSFALARYSVLPCMNARLISTTSSIPMMYTRLVSLNSAMNCPTMAGITLRMACGSEMSIVVCQPGSPSARAASAWPGCSACSPPRMFSAMYAALNSVITTAARNSEFCGKFSGNASGTSTCDMNSSVMSGTPLNTSMNTMHISFTTGSWLLRPSASAIPMGRLITMPATASSRFSISPPQ